MLAIFELIKGRDNYWSPQADMKFSPGEDMGSFKAWSQCPKPLDPTQIKRFHKTLKISEPSNGPSQDLIHYRTYALIISERASQAIEILEPNVHQFIKLESRFPKKYSRFFDGVDYYYLNIGQRLDALDIGKSCVKRLEVIPQSALDADPKLKQIIMISPTRDSNGDFIVVLDKNRVASTHLWLGAGQVFSHEIFVSDDLKASWEELGVGPMEYIKCGLTSA